MAAKKKENHDEETTAQKKTVAPASDSSEEDFPKELREPLWSVISFEKREVNGLSYDEAMRKITELETQGVSGLCIVTDEAAARISTKE